MLLSFKNKSEIKEKFIVSTYEWLNMKNKPKSAEERAKEIFKPERTYLPSECILENDEKFPDKLGLPHWLDNLLLTINLHNSNDFSGIGENYEEYFYPLSGERQSPLSGLTEPCTSLLQLMVFRKMSQISS